MTSITANSQPERKLEMTRIVVAALFFILFAYASATAADVYYFIGEDGSVYYTNMPGPGRIKVRPLHLGRIRHKMKNNNWNAAGRSETLEPIIATASRDYSVDPNIVRAVIKVESNYNERAVSPKGALGLMQLMPSTAREMGVTDAFDPSQNINGGVRYLSELLGIFGGDLPLALAAYNAGPARVLGTNRIPAIPETRSYVERVLGLYHHLKGRDAL